MFQLRYYAPDYKKQTHDHILSLLEQIKLKHNIPYEITQLRYRKSEYSDDNIPDEQHEKEIYEKDFIPRKVVLNQRTGESVRRLLRSRSGGYFLAGTIAITFKGQVEWFANYVQPFKEYDEDPALGFLKAVLDKGPILLSQLCPKIKKGTPELQLLDIFIDAGTLKGKFEREVKIGERIFKAQGAIFDWRKSVDLICETDTEVWILEGKNRLNYEALGEVLTYATIYPEESIGKRIKMGIICSMIEEDVSKACKKYNVTVFQIIGKDVRVYSP